MNYLLRRRGLGRGSCNKIVEHSQTGLEVRRNDQHLEPADIVIRWGTTSTVPYGGKVINTASAIHRVNDKSGFRKILREDRLCPKTWFRVQYVKFPCIVRPQFHHQGRHLYVCQDKLELQNAILDCGEGWYASEIIDKVAEYRVYGMQGRCAAVAQKFPDDPSRIAWNRVLGGKFENVRWHKWPLDVVKVGLKTLELSELDFSGIDIIVGRTGEPFVLEANSAPTVASSNYRTSIFAKIFDYMIQHGTEAIPPESGQGYRKFLHPALGE